MDTARVSPRPLTDQEWTRIERAEKRVGRVKERTQEELRRARKDRDAAIAAAVNNGASQTEIANRLGIRRQAVHQAVQRAEQD